MKLQEGYYLFGNKGNVWSKTAHIAKNDWSGRTLCGTPMLSNNWVRIEGITEPGCRDCIRLYKEQTEKVES